MNGWIEAFGNSYLLFCWFVCLFATSRGSLLSQSPDICPPCPHLHAASLGNRAVSVSMATNRIGCYNRTSLGWQVLGSELRLQVWRWRDKKLSASSHCSLDWSFRSGTEVNKRAHFRAAAPWPFYQGRQRHNFAAHLKTETCDWFPGKISWKKIKALNIDIKRVKRLQEEGQPSDLS